MKIRLVVAAVACLALGACNPPSDKKDENKVGTEQTQGAAEGVKSEAVEKIDQHANEMKQEVKNAAEDMHKQADQAAQDMHKKADEMSQDVSKKVDEMKKDMTDTASQMPGSTTAPAAPESTPPADVPAAPKAE